MNTTILWDGSTMLAGDAPASDLAAAVEYNLACRARYFAAQPGYHIVENERCMCVFNAHLYRVALARLGDEQPDQAIEAILSDARQRPRYTSWVVGPTSTPADLVERLKAQGFKVHMDEPAMAAPMAGLRAPPVDGLEVERIAPDDTGAIQRFNQLAEASFRRPISLGRQVCRLVDALGAGHPHLDAMRFYIGHYQGKAVASASVMIGGGVAGLYTVGTAPQARGKGIGTYMTYHALREAYREGLAVAVLHASSEGESIYRRMGFQAMGRMVWLSVSWHTLLDGLFRDRTPR